MKPQARMPKGISLLLGTALAAGLLAVASPPVHAAAAYSQHWDGAASTQGWGTVSSQAVVVGDAAAGLPPGSLASVLVPDGSPDPAIGMHGGSNLELRGDFTGHTWTMSFDVRLLFGPVESFALRLSIYDFPHRWLFPLAVPALDAWTHYVVEFNADWSDDEAFAAGWQRDGLAYLTFADSMGWVTSTQLRMELPDDATSALMNLDNFVLQPGGGNVPVPATAALVMLGLAGLGRCDRDRKPLQGFCDGASARVGSMLLFRDVGTPGR